MGIGSGNNVQTWIYLEAAAEEQGKQALVGAKPLWYLGSPDSETSQFPLLLSQ